MENNSITTYSPQGGLIPLSEAKMTAIQRWQQQPEQYYATLPVTTPRKMIEADTPTLWELRRQLGHPSAVAILVNAFIYAAKLVNLGDKQNLTDEQIGEAANDIIEQYGFLKVEEIKFLLKRALRSKEFYGRFDYNVLMNWVAEYDAERNEEAIRASDQKETQRANEVKESPDAVSFEEYMNGLRQQAANDPAAAKKIAGIENMKKQTAALQSAEEKDKRHHEFKMWKTFDYLAGKKL